MSNFSSWINPANAGRREIVYENRNKNYGGYVLRKSYYKILSSALLFTIVFTSLAFSFPIIVKYFEKQPIEKILKKNDVILLEDIPPIDKSIPPPQPLVIPEQSVKKTIKFVIPKVVRDEDVNEVPPTQEEVAGFQVSTVTQEGDKDAIEMQDNPSIKIEEEEDKIFDFVEEAPMFPGGDKKLLEYLFSQIKYPLKARQDGISGWVYVSFIIDKEGKIRSSKVVKGIGGGCDEEALAKIQTMPEWKPGRHNGMNVPVRKILRIKFDLKSISKNE